MTEHTTFGGSMVALITPFQRDGEIDWDAFARLLDFQLEGGTHGLVICGTTGEAATMSPDEQKRALAFTVKHAKGRVPVIAGTGSVSTKAAVELSVQAKEVGVDGLLVVTPPYNKPTQAGLIAHYNAIIEATQMPLILYNVPGRTCCNLLPETAAELAKSPHVVAIKDATADMNVGSQIKERCGDDLSLLSGDDFTALPLLSVGGEGWISVTANIAPRALADMYEAWQAGDVEKARKIHLKLLPLHRAMFMESNPIPCKKALHLMGHCEAAVRLPLLEMGEDHSQKLAEVLKAGELL